MRRQGETDKKGRSSRSHKDRTHGRRKEEADEDAAKKAKQHKNWRQQDIEERQARLTAAGGEGLRLRPTRRIASKAPHEAAAPVRPKSVTVSEPILVKDLSSALAVKATDIIGKLMQQGVMATANQAISSDVAELVALEFETELVVEKQGLPGRRDSQGVRRARASESEAAAGGRGHAGPRGPRQDQPAGPDSLDPGGGGRGRRHHAAHRRFAGQLGRQDGDVPRHARPRGVHGHAGPRREHDGYRGPGRGGRRRGDAPDDRGHRSQQGRRTCRSSSP